MEAKAVTWFYHCLNEFVHFGKQMDGEARSSRYKTILSVGGYGEAVDWGTMQELE